MYTLLEPIPDPLLTGFSRSLSTSSSSPGEALRSLAIGTLSPSTTPALKSPITASSLFSLPMLTRPTIAILILLRHLFIVGEPSA